MPSGIYFLLCCINFTSKSFFLTYNFKIFLSEIQFSRHKPICSEEIVSGQMVSPKRPWVAVGGFIGFLVSPWCGWLCQGSGNVCSIPVWKNKSQCLWAPSISKWDYGSCPSAREMSGLTGLFHRTEAPGRKSCYQNVSPNVNSIVT